MARVLVRRATAIRPTAADELDSAAVYALVCAAKAYDEGRGVKFTTFARHRILSALHDTLRRLRAGRPPGRPTTGPTS